MACGHGHADDDNRGRHHHRRGDHIALKCPVARRTRSGKSSFRDAIRVSGNGPVHFPPAMSARAEFIMRNSDWSRSVSMHWTAAGAQRQHVMQGIQFQPHRHALHHLNPVAAGVLRRQHADSSAPVDGLMPEDTSLRSIRDRIGVDDNPRRLAGLDAGQLAFFRLASIHFTSSYDREDRLALLDVFAGLGDTYRLGSSAGATMRVRRVQRRLLSAGHDALGTPDASRQEFQADRQAWRGPAGFSGQSSASPALLRLRSASSYFARDATPRSISFFWRWKTRR